MKKLLPYTSAIVLVVIGVLFGAVLAGDNVIAQRVADLTGSGTPGRIAKWTSSTVIGNSSISEDKKGVVNIANGIRFPDGSVQTTASTDSHFRQIKFTLAPGLTSPATDFPVQDAPVRLEISTNEIAEFLNGVIIINPPLLATGVVAQSSLTGRTGIAGAFATPELDGTVRITFVVGPSGITVRSYNAQFVTSPTIEFTINMWY